MCRSVLFIAGVFQFFFGEYLHTGVVSAKGDGWWGGGGDISDFAGAIEEFIGICLSDRDE